MAVLDSLKRVFESPSIVILEIVKYHYLTEQERRDYKLLYTLERIIPHLYIWLCIQMFIAITVFM